VERLWTLDSTLGAYCFSHEVQVTSPRGISQSALIVAAFEALIDASGQIDHLTPFIGVIKGVPPGLSEPVDDIYR
jgi:hypothetical protein